MKCRGKEVNSTGIMSQRSGGVSFFMGENLWGASRGRRERKQPKNNSMGGISLGYIIIFGM